LISRKLFSSQSKSFLDDGVAQPDAAPSQLRRRRASAPSVPQGRPFIAPDFNPGRELLQAEEDEALAEVDWLAEEIARAWRSPKSVLELIEEQRR